MNWDMRRPTRRLISSPEASWLQMKISPNHAHTPSPPSVTAPLSTPNVYTTGRGPQPVRGLYLLKWQMLHLACSHATGSCCFLCRAHVITYSFTRYPSYSIYRPHGLYRPIFSISPPQCFTTTEVSVPLYITPYISYLLVVVRYTSF